MHVVIMQYDFGSGVIVLSIVVVIVFFACVTVNVTVKGVSYQLGLFDTAGQVTVFTVIVCLLNSIFVINYNFLINI